MSKRNLLNLSLFIFIIALVTVVVYEPGKDVAIKPPTLSTIEINDITHIKINRPSADSSEREIEFKKTPNGWMMFKPYSVPANAFRIEAILEILSSVSFSQNSLKNLDLNTFGLEKPAATITFNNKTTFVFGHNKSLKNHRYIQIGSTLHLTADTYFYQLAAKSESYISHKLINTQSKIIKLTLPTMVLSKTDGRWEIKPKTNNSSADSINQLISEWQLSQAYDINKLQAKPNSKADIIIQLNNNKKINFKIEKDTNSFNLLNLDTGIRYILSSDRKDKLLKLSSVDQEKQESK